MSTVTRAPHEAATSRRPDDVISIDRLRLRCILGVPQEERRDKQDIVLSIRVGTNARPAEINDYVGSVWNYRTFTKAVIGHVEASSYVTVERLAEQVARIGVIEHAARWIEVTVHKPGALRFADSVGITIRRDIHDYTVPTSVADMGGAA